jgi:hypothetical protein
MAAARLEERPELFRKLRAAGLALTSDVKEAHVAKHFIILRYNSSFKL